MENAANVLGHPAAVWNILSPIVHRSLAQRHGYVSLQHNKPGSWRIVDLKSV